MTTKIGSKFTLGFLTIQLDKLLLASRLVSKNILKCALCHLFFFVSLKMARSVCFDLFSPVHLGETSHKSKAFVTENCSSDALWWKLEWLWRLRWIGVELVFCLIKSFAFWVGLVGTEAECIRASASRRGLSVWSFAAIHPRPVPLWAVASVLLKNSTSFTLHATDFPSYVQVGGNTPVCGRLRQVYVSSLHAEPRMPV